MSKDYTIGIYIRLSLADEIQAMATNPKVTALPTSVCSSTGIWMNRPRYPSVRDWSLPMTGIPVQIFAVHSSRP